VLVKGVFGTPNTGTPPNHQTRNTGEPEEVSAPDQDIRSPPVLQSHTPSMAQCMGAPRVEGLVTCSLSPSQVNPKKSARQTKQLRVADAVSVTQPYRDTLLIEEGLDCNPLKYNLVFKAHSYL